MIPQRQQPAYDPMAKMMQILQFALSHNQNVAQQANQDRNFALDRRQVNVREQQFKAQQMQQMAAQQAEQEYRRQQALNAQIGFALDERKLGLSAQDLNQRTLMQQEEQKQRQQQAVLAALSRVETPDGFQDPTALLAYLKSQGIDIPSETLMSPTVDPKKAAAEALFMKLGQQ